MDNSFTPAKKKEIFKEGQGYNDSRGEIPDQKDIPKHNGLNVDNDPKHLRDKAKDASVSER